MTKKRLLSIILASFVLFLGYSANAQNKSAVRDNYPDGKFPPGIQMFAAGDSCNGAGVEQHDGPIHGNGYTAFTDSVRMCILFHPASYPWQYTNVCMAFTRTSTGPTSHLYDIVVYDTLGAGGTPGSLLQVIPGNTVSNIAIYPLYSWNSQTVAINVSASLKAVYIGYRYANSAGAAFYCTVDEQASTPLWPGYYATNTTFPAVWQTIQSVAGFTAYKCMAIRTQGHSNASTCVYTYSHQLSNATVLFQTVCAVSPSIGWVAGATATVRRTTDGGNTWLNANPNPGVITGDIYNIAATDANNACLTTSPGATFIYRTTNGGTNWTQVFTQTGGFIDGIAFQNATTGFAYGDPVSARWSLWKTVNGGATWDSTGLYVPQVGTEAGWNNSINIKGTNIWFGTNNTKVYHSTNFGANWTSSATTFLDSYSMHYVDANTGLIGGETLNRSINGGGTYALLPSIGFGNITGMAGVGTNYWYVRGDSLYATTNTGDNWSLAFRDTKGLWGADVATVLGCGIGWAVGDSGKIIRIDVDSLVGIGTISNGIPNAYRLAQNYPNPFNPSTKISYEIPAPGIVSIVVYDILGREVETLVNEFKQAGKFTVEFNANSLASGVYFYKITAGTFVESKKMLLIK